MKTNSTKRLDCMKPLARDHGTVLVCAHYGRQAIRSSVLERINLANLILSLCLEEIVPNLEDEQWILSSLIGDSSLRHEFHERHRNIRRLTKQLNKLVILAQDPGLYLMASISNQLEDYVRWEENTLYPRIENGMEKDDLELLSRLTGSMELERNRGPFYSDKPRQVTLSTLASIPEDAQLLIAHCLFEKKSSISLLEADHCAAPLLNAKWLIAMPCPTIGITTFEIKPHIWCRLKSLASIYLSKELLSKLKRFRMRKSAYYPWIW